MSLTYPNFQKTATAKRDYSIDWSTNAASDAITAVTWSVPVGITNVASSYSGSVATIRLSGGTIGQTYLISCTATRQSGQIDKRSFLVTIVARNVVLVAVKDPAAALDYSIAWSSVLGADTVSTYSWSGDGLSIVGASNAATVRLSGGSAGQTYYPTVHIVTAAGQEDDRSIEISIQDS